MDYQTVSLQKVDHVMVVNLSDRVDDQAGIARLSDELTEICAGIAWDEEVRVVVQNSNAEA